MMFDDVCTFDSGLVDFALCRLRSDSRWSTCIAGWRNQMEVQHFSCGTPEIIGLPWLVILVSWSFPFSLWESTEFRRGWAYFALMYSIWCTLFRESPRTWRSTLGWPIMGLELFHYVAFAVYTGFRCSSCAPLIVIHWFWQAKKHIQYRTAIWQLLDCTKWIKGMRGLEFSKSGLEVLQHYSEYKSWVHEA